MQVKNAINNEAQRLITFLQGQIANLELLNAGLDNIPESWIFSRAAARAQNDRVIESYRDEIVELEDLRDGYLSVGRLGTARRFFNKMPAWATSGT